MNAPFAPAAIHCREYPLAQYYTEADLDTLFEGQVRTLDDRGAYPVAHFRDGRTLALNVALCPGCDQPVTDGWCADCEEHCHDMRRDVALVTGSGVVL